MEDFELLAVEDLSDKAYIPREQRPGFESSAAGGRMVEREFIEGLKRDEAVGKAEDLRSAITEMNNQINHIQASIEVLVGRMEAGRKIKGAEDLQAKLAEETNAEKNILLGEKMKLEEEKRVLESQLEKL
ncbi:MAG: hypothetical protein GW815_02595 [Candidatus Moranbacteria bacterium]|nr:hypothetical protein [Candidatus Moranbacteria bacterium]OIQ03717.1 MAG: hypothetical protein AUK58_01530 [Candidatus Moranbacteria bacterium CG2_30_41_165]PIP25585.1 MAG: hypothetical protein COX32_02645 [Candidatus Moranbacteria bacterium CG23_combo_of_CG06-09_8_20_14_all_41_28]PIV85928.1 MAG: hypothetical protein COW50_04380 [Candidatus Moranbacteria bacterium CG17_big_fil_post_rev_8_21_14_2_50_41_107]PIW94570.1 MAG: hypothetical protein COZ86_00305 [Candidatus Moranbacteria bacterium CG_